MEDLNKILKEVLTKEEYKKQIEQSILNKVIESINYKLSDKIYEIVENHFDDMFKAGIEDELKKADKLLKETILKVIKEKMEETAKNIVFEPYSWDFQKMVKEGVKIKPKS